EVNAQFPSKLQPLFEPHRYKVLYGGGGATKSWSIAMALVILAASRKLRILCCREIQTSISASVHQLLVDTIKRLGLAQQFYIVQSTIRSKNGSEFIFKGLRSSIQEIKSTEGIDICWVEEANLVSKFSWDTLTPTIRQPGSEIWISFNPELDTDETYVRFVLRSPPGAVVIKLNYTDNPFLPDVLKAEAEHSKVTDYDAYLHVWEGHTKQVLDGAIYANEIRKATKENRICRVPCDRMRPVNTYWDLGFSDQTTIWFAQTIAFEHRIVDYYSSRGE